MVDGTTDAHTPGTKGGEWLSITLQVRHEPMLEEQKQTLPRPVISSAPSLMTPEQCAEFLGIKINTLYVMKSQGRIPYRKVGHLLRFDFDEIVEWTKSKEK
jgi:excisionase family DNA binding protein